MGKLSLPKGYKPSLTIRETEVAIKALKDFFERELAAQLNLTRVSAPLFVKPESGLNDNLNGIERPVSFDILEQGGAEAEVVQSLAKWKRLALKRYGFTKGEGLYTDMNAIRRDEETDNMHSLYVDQWDWEKVIEKSERTVETLKETVRRIYKVLLAAEAFISCRYPYIEKSLPGDITFVTTYELEAKYPNLTPREREYEAVKEYGAIFLMQIGGKLASGELHDGRAPDYDDWNLNGDIVVNYPLLGISSFQIKHFSGYILASCNSDGAF
jgi:aspartate--ammonia ligase